MIMSKFEIRTILVHPAFTSPLIPSSCQGPSLMLNQSYSSRSSQHDSFEKDNIIHHILMVHVGSVSFHCTNELAQICNRISFAPHHLTVSLDKILLDHFPCILIAIVSLCLFKCRFATTCTACIIFLE